MTKEEAIAVLEKEASIIDDNSIEMTAGEWDEFDDLKRDAIHVAIEALQAEPVKHGEWVESEISNELYNCSNCGGACWSYDYERTIVKSNFCPNCGAKMDKDCSERERTMTREEAIKKINAIKKYLTAGNPIWDVREIDEVLDMAIDALTYQNLTKPNNTCEVDLISREDAIEAIQNAYCKPCKERGDDHNEVRCRACDFDDAIIQIDALPSVEVISQSEQYKKGFEDAKRAILVEYAREIENMQKRDVQLNGWIPCSERLPKNEGWVIVTILDEYGDTPYRYTAFGWYLEAANCWIIDAEQRTDVTAWMPLPKPYKEDSK